MTTTYVPGSVPEPSHQKLAPHGHVIPGLLTAVQLSFLDAHNLSICNGLKEKSDGGFNMG